jgi:penicillin-binding protein 1A
VKKLWQNYMGRFVLGALLFCGLSMISLLVAYNELTVNLPTIAQLVEYDPPQSTLVYSDEGELIGRFEKEFRRLVAFEKIPKHLIHAFLAAEDADFFRHEGLDYWGILRAALKNLRPGAHLQGASTITQQIVKTMIVGTERSYKRKLREAILARRLEQSLTKEQILYIYLNQIYFGSGAYGVEAAAKIYFDKNVTQLSVGEAAYLAAIPKNPSRYTLIKDPAAAKERQTYVLKQMFAHGWLAQSLMEKSIGKAVPAPSLLDQGFVVSKHYVEHVRRILAADFSEKEFFEGGMKIYTGLRLKAQKEAFRALRQGLEQIARTQGFQGARQRLEADVFSEYLELLHQNLAKQSILFARLHALPQSQTTYIWSFEKLDELDGLSLADLKSTMQVLRLEPGLQVKVPITKVNSIEDRIEFDLGECIGRVSLDEMKWARPFSPQGWTPAPKDLSEIVRRGDFLKVEILEKKIESSNDKNCHLAVKVIPEPVVQGAFVVLDPHTFMVNAMIGGYDGSGRGFNRVTQALRQPGSAFKPIVYATALAQGLIHQASLCADTPIVVRDVVSGEVWKPQNYETDEFSGNITQRLALAWSKNTCAVKLFEKLGAEEVIKMAGRLGVKSVLPDSLSLALGSGEMSPLELAKVYATFASGGFNAEPIFVRKITDKKGKIVLDKKRTLSQMLAPQLAYVLTDMLKAVFVQGTAKRYSSQKHVFAGKTGTSDESRDAWFVGYSPELVALSWVGFDDNQSLGRATGGSHALPIWSDFMESMLSNEPQRDFAQPPDIVFLSVDRVNGSLQETSQSVSMAFQKDNLPREQMQDHDSIFIADDEEENALFYERR